MGATRKATVVKRRVKTPKGTKKQSVIGHKKAKSADPVQRFIIDKIILTETKPSRSNNDYTINTSRDLKKNRLNFVQINKFANLNTGASDLAPQIFYFNTDDEDVKYLHSHPSLWTPPKGWIEQFSPLSGSEPEYDPEHWNENPNIKENHNCYAYAMNHIHSHRKGKPQPGYFTNFSSLRSSDYSCSEFEKRLKKDNPSLFKTKFEESCPAGYYKGFIAIDPKKEDSDYHFYRQDDNGYWSHKPGRQDVVDVDADGKKIVNPLYANRNYRFFNYKKPCFFFCVNPQLTRSHSVTKR